MKAPRDPAPSRIKYRLERLWLRPTVRNSVRVGLPLLAAAWLGVSLATDPGVQAWGSERITALRSAVASYPGLMVTRIEIDAPGIATEVRAAMDVTLPASSMDMDLAAIQDRIASLDAVAAAHVRMEGGGLLKVSVTERVPLLIWRHEDGLELLDAQGIRVGTAVDRKAHRHLPLIAGTGADAAVPEALRLLAVAAPVAPRLRGLVRVGERRWTLVLEDGPEILLPENGAAAALARVMALDAAEDITARDLVAVDMRDGRRPILRLRSDALLKLRRARGLVGEEDA